MDAAMQFVLWVMAVFMFDPGASALILERSTFELVDPASLDGGGVTWPANYQPDTGKVRVLFYTAQLEAGIHELAHAYNYETRHEYWPELLALCGDLADNPDPAYPTASQLCGDYASMWRHDGEWEWGADCEVFAGLTSGVMADLGEIPPAMRPIFGRLFRDREPLYLPLVTTRGL